MKDDKSVEVVQTGPPAVQPAEPSIVSIIQTAVASGTLSPEGLEKMLDVYERVDARRAEQEYAAALAKFQRACPKINLNMTVLNRDGRTTRYKYASLDHIMETLRPHLDANGFSVSWDSEITDGKVVATAIIRHVGGHTTRTTFSAPIEKDAYMNDSQKAGSAMTFAARYAVRLAFGLTPGDNDDDAGAANTNAITEEEVANIEALLGEIAGDAEEIRAKFLRYMGTQSVSEIQSRDYRKAIAALEKKRAER